MSGQDRGPPRLDRDILREVVFKSVKGQKYVGLSNFNFMYVNRQCRTNGMHSLAGLRDFYLHRMRAKAGGTKLDLFFNFETMEGYKCFRILFDFIFEMDPCMIKNLKVLDIPSDSVKDGQLKFKPWWIVDVLRRLQGVESLSFPFDASFFADARTARPFVELIFAYSRTLKVLRNVIDANLVPFAMRNYIGAITGCNMRTTMDLRGKELLSFYQRGPLMPKLTEHHRGVAMRLRCNGLDNTFNCLKRNFIRNVLTDLELHIVHSFSPEEAVGFFNSLRALRKLLPQLKSLKLKLIQLDYDPVDSYADEDEDVCESSSVVPLSAGRVNKVANQIIDWMRNNFVGYKLDVTLSLEVDYERQTSTLLTNAVRESRKFFPSFTLTEDRETPLSSQLSSDVKVHDRCKFRLRVVYRVLSYQMVDGSASRRKRLFRGSDPLDCMLSAIKSDEDTDY